MKMHAIFLYCLMLFFFTCCDRIQQTETLET